MKISLNWLKDYVSFGRSHERLAERLTMAGLEVEGIETVDQDVVLDLEITPNRPDCLHMIGFAREVSAILDQELKIPVVSPRKMPIAKYPVTVEDKKACAQYAAWEIHGVAIAPAPVRMQSRLKALGLRPINNIVDITNFCLLEQGQPLHAFDADRLQGGRIHVRWAKEGEKIVTIDGVERELDASVLVIADAQRPVAIAGIMGGKDTEVTAATKNIVLESAYFDPVLIRRTSRKLGLTSDSAYRFERGVNPENVVRGGLRAVDLILEEAKGTLTRAHAWRGGRPIVMKPIAVSVAAINDYLGAEIPAAEMKRILKKLDFKITGTAAKWQVTPPVFRRDIQIKEDVVEEVARVVGYDQLPSSMPVIRVSSVRQEPRREWRQRIRQWMMAQGCSEMVSYTMIATEQLTACRWESSRGVAIINPLTQDQEILRPTLLVNALKAVQTNVTKGQRDVKLFETGKIYTPAGEQEVLSVVITGSRKADWREPAKDVDYYDVKGLLEAILCRTGMEDISFQRSQLACFDAGQQAQIISQGQVVGLLGKLDADVCRQWQIKQQDVYFAEMDLEWIYRQAVPRVGFSPLNDFPSAIRDVSLAVDKKVTFQDVCQVIRQCRQDLLSEIRFKEEYTGEKIPAHQRGLVFSLVYQSPERTLREDEVTAAQQIICDALLQKLEAVQR